MDNTQYQGLFHLCLGVGSFLLLLLGLRAFATPKKENQSNLTETDDKWSQKEPLVILDVIDETDDIKSFRLQRVSKKKFPAFKQGQFLSFQIGDDPRTTRSYSISSAATNRSAIQISVKKIVEGTGSTWFHKRQPGDAVWAYPPSGHFSDADLDAENRIYIAGGIGITPLLSMVLSNIERVSPGPMYLFYGARTKKDLAFHEILDYLSRRYPQRLKYFPTLSRKSLDGEERTGAHGHITLPYIREKTELNADTHFFLCGPSPMMDGLIQQLLGSGFSEKQIHHEKFVSPLTFVPEAIPAREVQVKFQGQVFTYKSKQTLLEFLESQGIYPSYACRSGVCGACKCLSTGKVHSLTDAGLTLTDKENGYVLTCVSFPLEDIELQPID